MICSRTLGTALNATALGLSSLLMASVSHAAMSAAAPQGMGVSAAATSFTVSIILKVRDPEGLDEFIEALFGEKSGEENPDSRMTARQSLNHLQATTGRVGVEVLAHLGVAAPLGNGAKQVAGLFDVEFV